MDNKIVIIAKQSGLVKSKVEVLVSKFGGYFEEAKKIAQEARTIKVENEMDTLTMKKARQTRLALRKIRTQGVEPLRKELKAQSLREGKAIDGISNVIKALIIPVEEYLEKQEKFAEIKKAEREAKKLAERTEKLSKYVEDVSLYNLKDMLDNTFINLLAQEKTKWEEAKQQEKEAEQKRIAKEKAEQKERERIRLENIRLKKEAEKREKKLAKEREVQQKKIEAERKARKVIEVKLRKEKEAKEKKEREERRKEEAKKQAEEEAKRQALLAPDKDKLLLLANQLKQITYPNVQSREMGKIVDTVEVTVKKMVKFLITNSKK